MELVIIACGVVFGLIIGFMIWKNNKKTTVKKQEYTEAGRKLTKSNNLLT